MRLFKTGVVLTALACLSLTVVAQVAQQQNPAPDKALDKAVDKAMDQEVVDKAHENLLRDQTDRATEAAKMTDAVAASLPGSALSSGPVTRKNFVDEQIFGRMERDGVPHAPLAGDAEFMRRIYLDATGLPPTPEALRAFLADKDADKRDKLVDSLIGTDAFADQWAWLWMDLFQAKSASFSFWLKQWLKLDRPYNEVFAEIAGAGASKSSNSIPPWAATSVSLYHSSRLTNLLDQDNSLMRFNRLDYIDEVNVTLGRVFFGVNLECISCHDGAGHTETLNMWLSAKTRADFAQQAAFFGNYRSLSATQGVSDVAKGYTTGNDLPFWTDSENRFPRDGRTYEPAFIMTGEKPRPGANPRRELGRIGPSDLQFSRAAVNLIWGRLMGAGFVEPYDGFDLMRLDPNSPPPKPWALQPTNPWLLDEMAKDFQANKYSMHHLFKTIMKSSAYQLSTRFNEEWKDSYAPYYARRYVRVLGGPEVIDALGQITERPMTGFKEMGQPVARVKQLSDPANVSPTERVSQNNLFGEGTAEGNSIKGIIQAFFQTLRETPAILTNKASTVQAMMMMSSPVVKNRILAQSDSGVARILASGKTDEQVIEELYLRTLSRFPTAAETEVSVRILKEGDRRVAAEDIQWGLLNTPEFLLNH